MTDEEFERFLKSALDELWEKQERLQTDHGFGSFSRWYFDQATEQLELFDEADKKVAVADVIDIGSYAANSSTWKWAWSNESVLPGLRKRAEVLKELEAQTGVALFASEAAASIENEPMAWEIAALCVRHLNALGVYRAPSSSRPLFSFLALMNINRVQ